MANISVVIQTYRRPNNLPEQLSKLENQSIEPHQIIISHTKNDRTSEFNFGDYQVIEFKYDVGFRSKFVTASAVHHASDFVVIFDDDNMPGRKALENFYDSYKMKPGLYGSLGCDFTEDYYEHSAGRGVQNESIKKVSFVGQTLFFPVDYLEYYFSQLCPLSIKSGEDDIWFSYLCAQRGINRYVPPHDDIEKYPAKRMKTGDTALSSDYDDHESDRRKLINYWHDNLDMT